MRRGLDPGIGHQTRDFQEHAQTRHLVGRETTSSASVGSTATISTTTREATTTTAEGTPATATVHTRQVSTLGNDLLFQNKQV